MCYDELTRHADSPFVCTTAPPKNALNFVVLSWHYPTNTKRSLLRSHRPPKSDACHDTTAVLIRTKEANPTTQFTPFPLLPLTRCSSKTEFRIISPRMTEVKWTQILMQEIKKYLSAGRMPLTGTPLHVSVDWSLLYPAFSSSRAGISKSCRARPRASAASSAMPSSTCCSIIARRSSRARLEGRQGCQEWRQGLFFFFLQSVHCVSSAWRRGRWIVRGVRGSYG